MTEPKKPKATRFLVVAVDAEELTEAERDARRERPTMIVCACCRGEGLVTVEEHRSWRRTPPKPPTTDREPA